MFSLSEVSKSAMQISAPVWQQDAKDSQGRKRFHGAFTGGFSAGYFNTVGSRDGFTPAQFKSSRKDKEKGSSSRQRVEEFMDEEDMMEIADRAITVSDECRGMGMRMVNEMLMLRGERERDDVQGPSVQSFGGGYGNVELPIPKNNLYGIGYVPSDMEKESGMEKNSLALVSTSTASDARISVISNVDDRVKGFVQGDDQVMDESRELAGLRGFTSGKVKMSLDNQDAYDVHEEDDEVFYSGKAKKTEYESSIDFKSSKRKKSHKDSTAEQEAQKNFLSAKKHKYERCSDGNLPLEGFVLGKKEYSAKIEIHVDRIKVPSDFDGIHKFTESEDGICLSENLLSFKEQALKRKRLFQEHLLNLDPETKSRALGMSLSEQTLPSSAVEIKDELKENPENPISDSKPEEKISDLSKMKLSTALSDRFVVGSVQKYSKENQSALLEEIVRYRPFADQPQKQKRFEEYVKLQRDSQANSNVIGELAISRSGMTDSQIKLEDNEFKRLYEAMASGKSAEKASSKEGAPRSYSEAAAQGMYGRLTREVLEWRPSKLLCKRMNISDPWHGIPDQPKDAVSLALESQQRFDQIFAEVTGSKPESLKRKSRFSNLNIAPPPILKNSKSDFLLNPAPADLAAAEALFHPKPKSSQSKSLDQSAGIQEDQQISEKSTIPESLLETTKPSISLFKAIFDDIE
jgi:G patch domain-containing protein 1